MNITIRHATLKDAHAIAEAEREIAEEPGFFCSKPFELTDQIVENTLTKIIHNGAGLYLLAEINGEIVGHAFLEQYSIQSLRHIAELNIAVHKGWQGQGIGTLLLQNLIDWAKKSDTIEKIELNVRATNTAAISLYKKMGFQQEGRLKKRVKIKDQYIDDIIMGLDLKSL